MLRNIITGIDIGTATVRVVVCEQSKGKSGITIIGTGESENHGMRRGYSINQKETTLAIKRALKEAEKSSGTQIKRAFIGMGGMSMHAEFGYGLAVISRSDSEVTNLDIEKALAESEKSLELSNKRIIWSAPIAYKIDGKEVLGRPEGQKGAKLEVKTLFVTCLTQHADDLEETVIEAGIDILDIMPSTLALGHVVLQNRQKTVGAALLDVGAETVSLVVYENMVPIGLHIYGLGSADITNDIALGLKIPLEEAEGIKIGSIIGNYPKKKIDDIVSARLDDIFEVTENYLKKLKRNELLPAGIMLAGGGSFISNAPEYAKDFLKLPAKVATLDMESAQKGVVRDMRWFTAYGLCVLGYQEKHIVPEGSFSEFSKKTKGFFKNFFSQFRP